MKRKIFIWGIGLGLIALVAGMFLWTSEDTKKYQIHMDSNGGKALVPLKVKEGTKLSELEIPQKEGYTFLYWSMDGEILSGDTIITKDMNLVAVWETNIEIELLYGDFNLDQVVNEKDLELLKTYLQEPFELSEEAKKRGDLNLNGIIDQKDKEILEKHLNGEEAYQELPISSLGISEENNSSNPKEDTTEKEQPNKEDKKEEPVAPSILYGDVNQDGKVNGLDVVRLRKYLASMVELNEQQLKASDVNQDGKIDEFDVGLIRRSLIGYFKLPIKIISGDANMDGKVDGTDVLRIRKYIAKTIDFTTEQQVAADINLDGKIDDFDVYLLRLNQAKWNIPLPCTIYSGDINQDGEITYKDAKVLAKDIQEKKSLTGVEFASADMNLDQKVDEKDLSILKYYLMGLEEYQALPIANWNKEAIVFGDVNGDSRVNGIDRLRIEKYLANTIELDNRAQAASDVNLDGKIDQTDIDIIRKHLVQYEDYKFLPVVIE